MTVPTPGGATYTTVPNADFSLGSTPPGWTDSGVSGGFGTPRQETFTSATVNLDGNGPNTIALRYALPINASLRVDVKPAGGSNISPAPFCTTYQAGSSLCPT